MKSLSSKHTNSMRPRFTDSDYELILALAERNDIPPNVLVRHWVVKALEETRGIEDDDDIAVYID